MMKYLTAFLLCTCFNVLVFAQQTTDQIAQNGGFENGTGYPVAQNQLDGFCSYWVHGTLGNTPDWYTTQNLPGALQGPCNFESGDNQTVFNATPKISTHDNSLFYGGFGSTEFLRNELSRRTYANSLVKISFWFSPRGVERDTRIGVILVDTDDDQHNNIVYSFTCSADSGFSPCQWYYFESDWLPTGQYTFDQVQVGGLAPPNVAGAFNEKGYIYIDDMNVYNGLDCCPSFMRYENTNELTDETNVADFIEAGFDAGIPDMSGDVNIQNGHDVSFQAGNAVLLNAGFNVEAGATFSVSIEDCTPFTESTGNEIVIALVPNVVTPNGDGMNDDLCFLVSGAYYYSIKIFSRWGTANESLIYQYAGFNTSNHFCTWDGGTADDGTYYFIATFSNCTGTETTEGYFTLLRGNGRMAKPDSANTRLISVWPNPATETININLNDQDMYSTIELVNTLGEIVHIECITKTDKLVSFDISGLPSGYYMLRLSGQNESHTLPMILSD